MTGKDLIRWRTKTLGEDVTQRDAATRLGLSRRMYIYYEMNRYPIPLSVRLACAAIALGLEDYHGPAKGK
jgi:DNA-binding XRE family transcriptional regulator